MILSGGNIDAPTLRRVVSGELSRAPLLAPPIYSGAVEEPIDPQEDP